MTISGVTDAWRMQARMTVMSAIGRLQHVDQFSSAWATQGSPVVLTNGFLYRLNALEFDLKIFEGSKAWITENSVACVQFAVGFAVASAIHNRQRIR